jgi:2-isopropylmalate synthase
MHAEDVGAVGAQIVLGKHSGKHAFSKQLQDMGYTLTKEEIGRAFARFKELADRKVELTDKDLEAIVADEVYAAEDETFELVSYEVAGGSEHEPEATVKVRVVADGQVVEEHGTGDGMVDAACSAIRRATGVDGTLVNFNVAAVTKGVDALGDVTVQVEVDGRRYTGRGMSTDIVEASARAFVNALNKSVRLRNRGDAPTAETP